MAVSLTKPGEEVFSHPVHAIKEKVKSLVIGVEKPPQNPPTVAQSTTAYKEATVTTVGKKGRLHHEVKNIPLNDLTALNTDELRALTNQSVKEIEEAFALIQRVAAEGERRAELNGDWGDSHYTDVCKFHMGIFQKMAVYNRRHRKLHRHLYRKESDVGFWFVVVGTLAAVAAGAAFVILHLLGLS